MSLELLTLPRTKTEKETKRQPPYHVILLDDPDHTHEYVVRMLGQVFGHSREKAFRMAETVDTMGRCVVDTTSKERAELKRDQIHAFGADPECTECKGSMSATIEPAMGDEE